MKPILTPNKDYTFAAFFEMAQPASEIVNALGYDYLVETLKLPHFEISSAAIEPLLQLYLTKLPRISLNTEIARREFIIAPLLFKLLDFVKVDIFTEYPLSAPHLRGTLDYLIQSKDSPQLLIIEAKRGDMERGFNQLAAELVALDQTVDNGQPLLYGVVSLGTAWQFTVLQRNNKKIVRDLNTYAFPGDVHIMVSILAGIFESAAYSKNGQSSIPT